MNDDMIIEEFIGNLILDNQLDSAIRIFNRAIAAGEYIYIYSIAEVIATWIADVSFGMNTVLGNCRMATEKYESVNIEVCAGMDIMSANYVTKIEAIVKDTLSGNLCFRSGNEFKDFCIQYSIGDANPCIMHDYHVDLKVYLTQNGNYITENYRVLFGFDNTIMFNIMDSARLVANEICLGVSKENSVSNIEAEITKKLLSAGYEFAYTVCCAAFKVGGSKHVFDGIVVTSIADYEVLGAIRKLGEQLEG